MVRKAVFLPLIALFLVSLACGVNFSLPESSVETGPTQVEQINVPKPDASVVELTLSIGGGELILNPGAEQGLVAGQVTYNVADFKPQVEAEGDRISITQGDLNIEGIPAFEEEVVNEWNLALADSPLDLRIRAGAYVGEFDLGGLRLTNLSVKDGAASVTVDFSSANQSEMDVLDYQTGASSVSLLNLANANFGTLLFESGAGNYTLDFSGELKRNANVKIQSGLSTVRLIIPEGVAAEVRFEGGLTNVSTQGDWTEDNDSYSQPGQGPKLSITVEMGAGSLEIRNEP